MTHFISIVAICFGFTNVASAAKNSVVATVNNSKITLEEFNKEYERVEENTVNPPPKSVFLEDMVRFELGAQEAERQKIGNDPIVRKEIRKLKYKWLLEKKLGDQVEKIKVTESDMKRYYRRNPEIRTSHILIQLREGASNKDRKIAKERAQKIYNDVRRSKRKFEELVRLYTDDIPTKNNGGDLGWQTRVTTVPPYYKAALKTRTGSIAPLVETRYGFHIIKVTGRRSYEKANKRKIRFGVFEEKKKRLFDKYFAQLKSKAKIKTNTSLLK